MSCGGVSCPHCGAQNHCTAAVCGGCRRRLAGGLGVGDAVHGLTERLGIPQCQGCRDRQAALNRYRVPFTGNRGRR